MRPPTRTDGRKLNPSFEPSHRDSKNVDSRKEIDFRFTLIFHAVLGTGEGRGRNSKEGRIGEWRVHTENNFLPNPSNERPRFIDGEVALRALLGLSLSIMAAVEVEVSGNAMNVRTAAAVAGGRRSPPARSIYQAVLVALCRSALSLSQSRMKNSLLRSLAFQSQRHFGLELEQRPNTISCRTEKSTAKLQDRMAKQD